EDALLRCIQETLWSDGAPQDFHSKYGLGVLVSGTVFYSLVWGYVLTETRIEWNLSPVKRVIEKNW
uniref:Cytochrome c oxidase subunit 7B, mitochondrial n=1 Tax=Fundulus heteroclitus TaxID=8078 RepID=A0A3Q2SSA6_FUNHE